jgi:heptosyltransferase-2
MGGKKEENPPKMTETTIGKKNLHCQNAGSSEKNSAARVGNQPKSRPCRITLDKEQFRNGIAVRMPNQLSEVVMALPALVSLRSILPKHCALYVIAPASFRHIFQSIEEVDGFLPIARSHRAWRKEELRDLHMLRLGIGVIMKFSLRDAFMMRLAGITNIFGISKRIHSPLVQNPLSEKETAKIALCHREKYYSELAAALGAVNPRMPKFALKKLYGHTGEKFSAILEHPQMLLLTPGGADFFARVWPAEKFNLVAAYWIRRGGIVVVAGNASEKNIGERIIRGAEPGYAFNLCGKTSSGDLMRLISAANCVIGTDSGAMHLAAAMGKPGVSIFGPTDPAISAPLSQRWRIIRSRKECSPCRGRICKMVPKDRQSTQYSPCFEEISVHRVLDELVSLCRCQHLVLGKYHKKS